MASFIRHNLLPVSRRCLPSGVQSVLYCQSFLPTSTLSSGSLQRKLSSAHRWSTTSATVTMTSATTSTIPSDKWKVAIIGKSSYTIIHREFCGLGWSKCSREKLTAATDTHTGSGNWGSAIAKIVGENTDNQPELFDKGVRMWMFEEQVRLTAHTLGLPLPLSSLAMQQFISSLPTRSLVTSVQRQTAVPTIQREA